MTFPIYLDYMATTPVDPLVAKKMAECLTQDGVFGNPASTMHTYGKQAAERVEHARAQVAALIHAAPREIIWTSGATEANNLAICGAAQQYADKGKHIITSQIEHKAVLDVCRHLEQQGFEITYLKPNHRGLLDLDALKQAIKPTTTLVSLMHVNNEIGVINDIAAISDITRKAGVLLHVDAAQSAGKLPIDVTQCHVDLMSFSAHKCYGPKGIGALYVRLRPRVRLTPQQYGGNQEQGLRAGTLPTHQIVGMGEAYALAQTLMSEESARITALTQRLWQGIADIPHIQLNGDAEQRLYGNLNMTFQGVSEKNLQQALQPLAISSGSACNSFKTDRSHVLRAIGLNNEQIASSLRFSLGRYSTIEEIDFTVKLIHNMMK